MWEILWVLSTSWPPPSLQLGDSLSPSTQSLLIHIECCQASFALLRCFFWPNDDYKDESLKAWSSWHLPNETSDEVGQRGGDQHGGEGDDGEIDFFLSVQWELRFRSGTLEWSLRSCLGPTGTRGPRSTSWRLMGSSGKLDLVTMTDVIVIIILLWSIESDMAVVPTPLLELIQRARSCTSSSTRATKALISHRWEVPTCVPTVPTGGNEENYFCEHYCRGV